MQPDDERCAVCECTVCRRRRFVGAKPTGVMHVALCDVCNRIVVREATAMQLPKLFPRVTVIRPAPAPVLVELARELSMAVRT
jgi:hypothetical protein